MEVATIRIGGQERNLADVEPSWVAQQIDGRRGDGQPVCVEVRIQRPGCDLRLTTPQCAPRGIGGRAPNCAEQEIIELWKRNHLLLPDYSAGNVIAFTKQVRRHLS
ncbi:MAG: hypothetical protein R3B13_10690 [Polyangiaceae bacterium]